MKIGRKNDEIKVLKNRLEYAERRIERLRRDNLGYSEMKLAMNAVIYRFAQRYGQERYENGRLIGWHLEIERPEVSKVQQERVNIRKVGNEWYIGVLSAEGATEGEATPESREHTEDKAGIQAASGGVPDGGTAALRSGAEEKLPQAASGAKGGEAG